MSALSRHRAQTGLTLVELLVCMALALTLSLAAVSAVISSRATLSNQDESSRLVDSGLYALSVVERAVRQAGFEPWTGPQSAGSTLTPVVLGLDDASLPATSAALAGATSPGINRSDVLALRYMGSGEGAGDGSMLNCAGVAVAEPAAFDAENGRAWSIFHVGRTDAASEPELRCKYRSEDGLKWDSQAVASGVEAMQVLYGVDQDGDGLPDRYRRAADMPDTSAWRGVVAVHVSLLVRGGQFQSEASGKRVHALFGASYAGAAQDAGALIDEARLPADERKRLRRVFSLTMGLRNRGSPGTATTPSTSVAPVSSGSAT